MRDPEQSSLGLQAIDDWTATLCYRFFVRGAAFRTEGVGDESWRYGLCYGLLISGERNIAEARVLATPIGGRRVEMRTGCSAGSSLPFSHFSCLAGKIEKPFQLSDASSDFTMW